MLSDFIRLFSVLLAICAVIDLNAEEKPIEFDVGRPRPTKDGTPVLGSGLAMSRGSFQGMPVGELPRWTVSLWFQADSTEKGDLFSVLSNRQRGEGYQLSLSNGRLRLEKVGGDAKRRWVKEAGEVSPGGWRHVVITCAHDTGATLYLDGDVMEFGSKASMSYSLPFDEYFIGPKLLHEERQPVEFNGLVDDFELHERALSADEVERLFVGEEFGESLVAFNDFENVNHRDLAFFSESDRDEAYLDEGKQLYELHCVACHSKDGITPPVNPLSRFFSKFPMENGGDPLSMFRTVTYGFRNMMPATQLEPSERYKVIHYIREQLVKKNAPELYVSVDPDYISNMPVSPEASQEEIMRTERLAAKGYLRDFGKALCTPVNRADRKRISSPNALVIDLGNETTVAYDLGSMRSIGAWKGGFLDFSYTLHHKLRAPGLPTERFENLPGTDQWQWSWDGRAENPVPDLGKPTLYPSEQIRYRGYYPFGDEITLSYEVLGRSVLESPLAETIGAATVLHRRLTVQPGEQKLEATVLSGEGMKFSISGQSVTVEDGETQYAAWLQGGRGATWRITDSGDALALTIPASDQVLHLNVAVATGEGGGSGFESPADRVFDLTARVKGGPERWKTTHTMKGKPDASHFQGYALDSVPVPLKNAYNAWLRTASLAFFDDGRLAVASLSGDVWIASGINDDLDQVTWKRFASGLYEPMGMKVVDGTLVAITRGRIMKLHDFNSDGEADFYEAFFNEEEPDRGWHAYSCDLVVGDDGSFFYARTGGFSEWSVPGGIVKVAADGKSSELYGVGMRVPNGIGRLPDGRITFGDNQGTYVPASKIAISKPGDFHGAGKWDQREGDFDPEQIVQPIVYMPQELDSSSGSQLWVEKDERFGPLSGKLFHTSFGRARTMYAMIDEVDGVTQGAVFSIPMQMESGTLRAARNPKDGQIYYSGLTGWQAGGSKEGSIQRLRYTGDKGLYLLDAKAREGRLEMTFSEPINREQIDLSEWQVESWNYRWGKQYGSPHLKPSQPDQQGSEIWSVEGFEIEDGGRRLVLSVPDLQPCHTLKLDFSVAAGKLVLDGPVFFTIYHLPK